MRPGTQTAHRSALGLPYLLALPHAWAPAEDGAAGTWPLLVYLHGAGESGTDPNELLSEGATGTPPMLAAAGRQSARRPVTSSEGGTSTCSRAPQARCRRAL